MGKGLGHCASRSWIASWTQAAMWLSSLKRQHVGTEPSSAKKRVLERRTTPLMPSPPRRIPGSAFQAGTFLNQFAKFIVHAAVLALGRPVVTAPLLGSSGRVHAHAKKPKKVKIVSVCSGSEGLLTGLHELNACYKEEQIDLELGLVCSCEKDDWKRGWCKRVHEVIDEDMEHPSDACIFHNVETLAAEGADVCDAHKVQSDDKCKLPDWFDGLVAGFSCKDLSRANFRSIIKSCGGAPLDLMTTRSSPGQTLNTLHAILKKSWGVIALTGQYLGMLASREKPESIVVGLVAVLSHRVGLWYEEVCPQCKPVCAPSEPNACIPYPCSPASQAITRAER